MYKTVSFKRNLIAVAVASCSVLGLSQVEAAETAAAANTVEEVIVTATKRSTALQDTPLAISAITEDSLKENNVTSVADLVGMVPSMQFRTSADHAAPMLFIRGMGTQNQTEAGDSAVAFYVDGVFAARAQGSTVMAFDLERAEVLRGPQGTLFGRNSTAGAVSMVTAKPKLGEFEASGDYITGSNNRQGTQVSMNLPLTDIWSIRIAGATEKEDGETKNTAVYTDAGSGREFTTDENYGTVDLSALRFSSLMKPNENLTWYLGYEKFKNQGTGDVPTLDFDDRSQNSPAPGHIDLDSTNIRTRLDYTFSDSDITLSYIGGQSTFDQSQLHGDEYGNLAHTVWSTYEGTQHELQLANGDDNRFRWTAGAFLFKENNGIRFDIPHGSWGFTAQDSAAGVLSTFIQPNRSLESSSFYGQGTFDVNDDFRLTGGLRYTDDTREDKDGRSVDCTYMPDDLTKVTIVADSSFLAGGQGCYNRQYNDMSYSGDATTYLVRAEWDLSDDIMLFVSNGTGWKSGVVQDGLGWAAVAKTPANANSALDFSLNNELVQNPEEVMNTEFGMKGQFGNLTLNANLFFMDFTDMQVSSTAVDPVTKQGTVRNTNAGSATIQGIEVEATLLVGDAGTLTASGSLLDASYDEFDTTETSYGATQGQVWNPCSSGKTSGGACVDGLYDLSGNVMPYAPEVSFSLGYKHEISLASGASISPRIRMTYSGEYFFDQFNRSSRPAKTIDAADPGTGDVTSQDAYSKFDLGLTYNAAGGQWSADLFVDNATNEAIKESQGSRTGYKYAYNWADGREFGLRLNYKLQ